MRLMFLVLLACSGAAHAQDPANGWFQPSLSVDEDAACAPILENARAEFRTGDFWYNSFVTTSTMGDLEPVGAGAFREIPAQNKKRFSGRGAHVLEIPGEAGPSYVAFWNSPGCGGACERSEVLVTRTPDGADSPALPSMDSWLLARRDSSLYLLGRGDQRVSVWKFTAGTVRPVCEISLQPTPAVIAARHGYAAAAPAVSDYADAMREISRGSGWCGSMNTPARLYGYMSKGFETLFYRPWALGGSVDSSIQTWGLLGIAEHDKVAAAERKLQVARPRLAAFYASEFGFTPDVARSVADSALQGAAALGFLFGGEYETFDAATQKQLITTPLPSGLEGDLRSAILDHAPMDRIRALEPDSATIDGGWGESVLAAAVRYPEALAYLLERGANPDRGNLFGKTPLMYAAQYDELASVELLLTHGADVNASTDIPFDNCSFTLKTSEMTALHYAVRYASPAVIRRLLSAGALNFAAARGADSGTTPLEWLKYFGDQSTDTRKGILDESLLRDLAVPDDAGRKQISMKLFDRGIADYRAGKAETAFRQIRDAQRAAPLNVIAISDLSIIALRAGHVRESLAASYQVRTMTRDPSLIAGSWFNSALACDSPHPAQFNQDLNYCRESSLYRYVESWKAYPSTARESKVAKTLDNTHVGCTVERPDGKREQYYFVLSTDPLGTSPEFRQKIYVRHSRGSPPPDDAAVDRDEYRDDPERIVHSSLIERVDFRDFSLTILGTDGNMQGTVFIRGQMCQIN